LAYAFTLAFDVFVAIYLATATSVESPTSAFARMFASERLSFARFAVSVADGRVDAVDDVAAVEADEAGAADGGDGAAEPFALSTDERPFDEHANPAVAALTMRSFPSVERVRIMEYLQRAD